MRRRAKVFVAVVAVAAVAAVGLAVGSAVGAGPASDWACKPDRTALDINEYRQGGGSATAAKAPQNEADTLAQYGVATPSQLDQPLASASGATRHDASNGMLYVDGSVVAQFSAQQLPDKSWGVGSTEYCSPPAGTSPIQTVAGINFSRDHGPFGTGQRGISLAEAQASAGLPLVRPQSVLANDGNIRAIYTETAPGDPSETDTCRRHDIVHAAIDYQSGILVEIQLVAGTGCPLDRDPAAEWRSMASGYAGWHVGTVDGLPALMVPRDSSGPASVSFVVRGVEVTIYGQYAPIDLPKLIGVARSVS